MPPVAAFGVRRLEVDSYILSVFPRSAADCPCGLIVVSPTSALWALSRRSASSRCTFSGMPRKLPVTMPEYHSLTVSPEAASTSSVSCFLNASLAAAFTRASSASRSVSSFVSGWTAAPTVRRAAPGGVPAGGRHGSRPERELAGTRARLRGQWRWTATPMAVGRRLGGVRAGGQQILPERELAGPADHRSHADPPIASAGLEIGRARRDDERTVAAQCPLHSSWSRAPGG